MSRHWLVLWAVAALCWGTTTALAQQGRPPRDEQAESAEPDQPVAPQGPTFGCRPAPRDDAEADAPPPVERRERVASQRADRGGYDGASGDRSDDPRARDPREAGPPRGRQPQADPRDTDSRYANPSAADPRSAEPRATEPRTTDPRAGDPRSSAAAHPSAVKPPIPPPTPEQERFLDEVLGYWEKCSAKVNAFECQLVRLEYDRLNGKGDKPLSEDRGELKYMAPDRGLFVINKPREERWLCDGAAVFQYDYRAKQVQEFKLPPELQGKGIAESPLPFIFGANRALLKRRYYLQITTPVDRKGEVWVKAYPRFQGDARNFRSVEIILLENKEMLPLAMEVVQPNGDNKTVYLFQNPQINKTGGIAKLWTSDWWKFKLPGRDWQFVADPSQAQERRGATSADDAPRSPAAGRAASGGRPRETMR